MESIHAHLMIDLASLEHEARIATAADQARTALVAPRAITRATVASALVALATRIAPQR